MVYTETIKFRIMDFILTNFNSKIKFMDISTTGPQGQYIHNIYTDNDTTIMVKLQKDEKNITNRPLKNFDWDTLHFIYTKMKKILNTKETMKIHDKTFFKF